MCLLFCIVSGCLSGGDRDDPSQLIVSPTSGYPGDVLSLTLSADGTALNTCQNGSLEFSGDEGTSPFTVHRIDALLHEAGSVRAYISIDFDAIPGEYQTAFLCNSETTLTGSFRINELPEDIELTIDKPTVRAGEFSLDLNLSTSYPFFEEDSYVLFGQGSDVTVTRATLLSQTELALTVNISPYAATGDINVTAISGDRLARGVLTISDRIKSTIYVSPEAVERQAPGENTARTHELTIRGEGIDFLEPVLDAGAEDEGVTTISFPEEPSITVREFSVVEETITVMEDNVAVTAVEKQIKATIAVDELATLGGTTLQVSTGETSAWTNLTVLLPTGTPYLKIENRTPVPRNGKPTLVFAEAINFDFEDTVGVRCIESSCDVLNYTVGQAPYKKMDIEMRVGSDFEEGFATLEVETEGGVHAPARVEVGSVEAVTLIPDSETLTQGTAETIVGFTLSGDKLFDSATTEVSVLPRSGLRVTNVAFSSDEAILYVWFTVASEAPTGPAYIRVESGLDIYEAPLYIEPDAGMPRLSMFPGATLRKRNVVSLEVRADGLSLPEEMADYQFDDPGLKVLEAVPAADHVDLTIDVSPRARTDMSVLYVNGEDTKGAATFRVLNSPPLEILTPSTEIIPRGQTVTLQVSDPDIYFERPTVEEVEGIGINVWRYSGGQNLVFDLNADTYGPGGWTGLIVHENAESYLMRVYIQASDDNDDLTAQLTPNTIYPGTRTTEVTASLASQINLDSSMLTVQAGIDGIYISNERIEAGKVIFSLDIAADADTTSGPAPIYITAEQGAAVGFLSFQQINPIAVSDGTTWTGNPSAGMTVLNIDPGPAPSLVTGSIGRPEFAEPGMALLSENQLDLSATAENGEIWITRRAPVTLEVTSENEIQPVAIDVRSTGRSAVRENDEVPSAEAPAWTLDNPCQSPFLGAGELSDGLDADHVLISETRCRLIAVVLARDLANRSWDTPDTKIELSNASGTVIDENAGWPTARDPDPRIYIDEGLVDTTLSILPELGSAGSYWIHIRRPTIIREINRAPDSPFIELATEPGTAIDGLRLELFDAEEGAFLESLSLADLTVENNGIIVVSGDMSPVAIFPDTGAFAVLLYDGETIIDAVQIGEGGVSYGEGDPLPMTEDVLVYFRVADIDTDDNMEDFIPGYEATPGE